MKNRIHILYLDSIFGDFKGIPFAPSITIRNYLMRRFKCRHATSYGYGCILHFSNELEVAAFRLEHPDIAFSRGFKVLSQEEYKNMDYYETLGID